MYQSPLVAPTRFSLTFTYYSDGSVVTRTDAEGRTFTHTYDEQGRRIETGVAVDDYHEDANPTRRIAYGYRSDGLIAEVTAYDEADAVLYQNTFEPTSPT